MKKDTKQNVQPLGDRVLVKPLTDDTKKTSSGIIIPDTVSKEKPEQGVVVALGAGKKDENGKIVPIAGIKVGDKVLFSKYGFDEVKIEDEEYFIIREDNVLAVIK